MGLIAISIGAGLYEELLFRMLLFFLVHTLVVDLLRFSSLIGTVLAIVLSAVLFALYHPPVGPEATYTSARAFFYIAAGLFFGLVYAVRGFGIVVAVHAFYDLVTLFAPD
jgi:membrane protease YdiL (CAAX protease family)